jgi:hypothetical protein
MQGWSTLYVSELVAAVEGVKERTLVQLEEVAPAVEGVLLFQKSSMPVF